MSVPTKPSCPKTTFILERNQKYITRLPTPGAQGKKLLTEEVLTNNIANIWFREVPEQLQKSVHQQRFPLDKSVEVLGYPDKPVPSGMGMLICLMEDGSCTKGIASMIAENTLLTSSQLLQKEGTRPTKVFFATSDNHSIGVIVEADGWKIGPDLLSDEATVFGFAIIHCRLLKKNPVFGVHVAASSERKFPVVGYKLVMWTSFEYPHQLICQIRQGQPSNTNRQPFDEGSPLAVANSPFAGIYSHGQEILFTPVLLKELDILSETMYVTAAYRPGIVLSEPLLTIPMLIKLRNLQKMKFSIFCKDVDKAPLGDEGIKEIAKGEWPFLTEAHLEGTLLGDEGIASIVQAGWSNLTTAALEGNPFGIEGLIMLCRAHWPHLSSLNFCSCAITQTT